MQTYTHKYISIQQELPTPYLHKFWPVSIFIVFRFSLTRFICHPTRTNTAHGLFNREPTHDSRSRDPKTTCFPRFISVGIRGCLLRLGVGANCLKDVSKGRVSNIISFQIPQTEFLFFCRKIQMCEIEWICSLWHYYKIILLDYFFLSLSLFEIEMYKFTV